MVLLPKKRRNDVQGAFAIVSYVRLDQLSCTIEFDLIRAAALWNTLTVSFWSHLGAYRALRNLRMVAPLIHAHSHSGLAPISVRGRSLG